MDTEKLKTALEKLQQVRDLLPDPAQIDAQIQQLRDQLRTNQLQLRDLENSVVQQGNANINIQLDASVPRARRNLQAFFDAMARQCGKLPLEAIDEQFLTPGKPAPGINDVYVNLDARPIAGPQGDDPGEMAHAREAASDRQPLLELLAEHPRVVLLGEPGSGKSTFVNYLSGYLARAHGQAAEALAEEVPVAFQGLIPIRLLLREVAARRLPAGLRQGQMRMLWDHLRDELAACQASDEATGESLDLLHKRLSDEGGLIFLDGLDEAPLADGRRQRLLEAINHLSESLPNCRFLVTARPWAYPQPVLENFVVTSVQTLTKDQQSGFIEGWYRTMQRYLEMPAAKANERAEGLRMALQQRPHLRGLAQRPLLLTLMATLHSTTGTLPRDRARLYDASVNLLLKRWMDRRVTLDEQGNRLVEQGIGHLLDTDPDVLRRLLGRLALDQHHRQGEAEDSDQDLPADIELPDLLDAFRPVTQGLEERERALVEYLDHHAGLLIANEQQGPYHFYHRSFQEFLAADYQVSRTGYPGALRDLVCTDPDWWREVFLLAAGRVGEGNLPDLLNRLVHGEPAQDETAVPLRNAMLGAEALLEQRIPERMLEWVQDAEYNREQLREWTHIRERMRRWLLAAMPSGQLAAVHRAQAGDLLGQLGDPRETVVPRAPGPPPMETCCIPPGTVEIDGKSHSLEGFDLARFPVTVAQFAAFVDAGGYDQQAHWTSAGWAWRCGELDRWDDADQWGWLLKHRPVTQRGQPVAWQQQLERPNRPVMGVSWFEAMAFCAWYAATGGRAARLPSEAEWLLAAAGPGGMARDYPWGKWEEAAPQRRLNLKDSGIGSASVVGCFPLGASPQGLEELAGNVWEWTMSNEKGEDPDQSGWRVIKGGSWGSPQESARCSFRGRHNPGYFYYRVLGFRVLFSPAAS